jgi:hypothetical protein
VATGIGVWRVQALDGQRFALRHAQRGASEQVTSFDGVLDQLAPYFEAGGHMLDQAWQPRLPEGMTRAYLVRDRVVGFGHQAINALYPALEGEAAPQPGPRLYSGPDDPRFQDLRRRLESAWDFLLGERHAGTVDERYVLCEINVSSVSPFPPSAIPELVLASHQALQARQASLNSR